MSHAIGRELGFLYRGPLASCNYGCVYCPFAKKVDSRAELAADRAALARFVDFLAGRVDDRVSVLFTPWGEGLVKRWYRDAMVRLSHLPHVARVAIQTNLSSDVGFVAEGDPSRLAFWTTYHPEWTNRAKFLAKVEGLHRRGISVSVGVVGFARFAEAIEALRRDLPPAIYLWINAAKREETYTDALVARLSAIDPLFVTNTKYHPSAGKACATGERVVSVDGNGDVRRCHFVSEVIGNLYDGTFDAALRPRPCPNATCGCHIGYVHLDELDLHRAYGGGLFERVATPDARRRLALVQAS